MSSCPSSKHWMEKNRQLLRFMTSFAMTDPVPPVTTILRLPPHAAFVKTGHHIAM